MRLDCACGKTYRAADQDCPDCGATLRPRPDDVPRRPVPPGAAQVDREVLVRQKLALRDELRVRDRDLRRAEIRIRALQAELDRLKAPAQVIRIASSPLRVLEASARPTELSLERTELSMLPLADEAPLLPNAILLPDDRLPALEPERL